MLAAALDELLEGCWGEVTAGGEQHLVLRVPGGWHLPGDLSVASEDVADGRPSRVEVLGNDVAGRVEVIELARQHLRGALVLLVPGPREFAAGRGYRLPAGRWHPAAGALRDEVDAWLALAGEDPGNVAGCQPW